ncbi:hypothetical protein [Neobacillus thermocopriae]|uniref:Uncharacterized protein n=1 Tax=Neobacillus thermocopriae TaxID=1215031 RepID=A0A6B3TNL8_9BACI|nr:hypothetical protein [Neobacillus thermocopriae]MED3624132.1 hypothetical protein [Neobacillus thermocopriae]MED3713673.1 hypothetical protein [Neobacillus thermocopriae]NEX78182.1 hypothetical protein [Neobacillus thermocopriae]
MSIGVIFVWLALAIYAIIIWKAKIIDKKERKWVILVLALAIAVSVLAMQNMFLNGITSFLGNTFGRITRLVVKI